MINYIVDIITGDRSAIGGIKQKHREQKKHCHGLVLCW